MKKQMTAMDLGMVFVAVIAAIIAISASQQFARRASVPNLTEIRSNVAVTEEKPADLTVSGARGEGEGQYSAVVINPSTGQAEAVEYAAPRLSSLKKAAAPEASIAGSEKAFRAVVVHPETGAQLYEWQAPSVSGLVTTAAPEASITGSEKAFRTVVVHPETGARLYEWQAPSAK